VTHATRKIVIIEDEPEIRNVVRVLLAREGYNFVDAATGARGEIEARTHKPDLLLVDLGLPDTDGFTLIRRLRAESSVPIIVLSARSMESQKNAALDAGADDYVTKPFSALELLARVRAGLRRNARGAHATTTLRLGSIQIDLTRRRTRDARGDIHLTPLEYRLLECLIRQTGMLVRQRQILREISRPDRADDPRSLRVCIKCLRQKIEPDPRRPRYLVTEIGLGYRLCADETAQMHGSDPRSAPA
jgi:two-component system KDP operon response regulator KdpE